MRNDVRTDETTDFDLLEAGLGQCVDERDLRLERDQDRFVLKAITRTDFAKLETISKGFRAICVQHGVG